MFHRHNWYIKSLLMNFNVLGHSSDKSLEGYIANTTVMKDAAASALAFNSLARIPKAVVPHAAVVGRPSGIATIYNITISNCPGVNITMGGIGENE
jgi:hypothetical protein